MAYLEKYLQNGQKNKAVIAYLAALDHLEEKFPEIERSIVQEIKDQRSNLKLIASENYSSFAVQLAMGNLLTDKYSEGFPFHRFYAGCENVDAIESLAIDLVKRLFNADHAYVQPHSGADANMVAFWTILVQRVQSKEIEKLGKKTIDELTPAEYEKVRKIVCSQRVMGMSLNSGGHLTHGYRHNISSKMMRSFGYEVDAKTGLLNYSKLEKQVKKVKPLILIAGYSSYPRLIDFAKMREIADSVGATLMVDMAHFAGLVAGGVMEGNFNPVPFAQIVTSTTHKTLRGPRGGLVLCKEEFKDTLNKGCPLVLGGPLPHVIAAKAIAFKEALAPSFKEYAQQIVKNARALADKLLSLGVRVLTDGTDNHLLIIDVAKSFQLTGRQAELALRMAKITVNRNSIPGDLHGPWYTSGVRLGTPALTTLGMKEQEMQKIAEIIFYTLKNSVPEADDKGNTRAKIKIDNTILTKAEGEVRELLQKFPLYPELIID